MTVFMSLPMKFFPASQHMTNPCFCQIDGMLSSSWILVNNRWRKDEYLQSVLEILNFMI